MSTLSRELRALETSERVRAFLAGLPDRDETIARLIAAIEDDRAELLAAMLGAQAVGREPQRIRSPIT